jgi:hypothetical protein
MTTTEKISEKNRRLKITAEKREAKIVTHRCHNLIAKKLR